jgi:phenylalanyl-tRNA synthetase beta subunit
VVFSLAILTPDMYCVSVFNLKVSTSQFIHMLMVSGRDGYELNSSGGLSPTDTLLIATCRPYSAFPSYVPDIALVLSADGSERYGISSFDPDTSVVRATESAARSSLLKSTGIVNILNGISKVASSISSIGYFLISFYQVVYLC